MEASASLDIPDAEALARAEPLLEAAAVRLMTRLLEDRRLVDRQRERSLRSDVRRPLR
jgi:hypothetical protein